MYNNKYIHTVIYKGRVTKENREEGIRQWIIPIIKDSLLQ